MRIFSKFTPPFLFILLIMASCTKLDLEKERDIQAYDQSVLTAGGGSQYTSADFIPIDGDSIERITTLGARLTNPYLIPNMQQAYTNLGLSSSLATITNKYVRFKPTTVDQLATLDSTLDAQNLEMFDTPVDYVVTYEGDYYQDPAIPDSLPTWQYAVVPTNFVSPSGITYEVLAQIHIPGDSYTAVETEAERLASLQDNLNGASSTSLDENVAPNSAEDCPSCYVWDPIARKCVRDASCGTNPPAPAADAAVPAGNIFVHDTNLPTFPGAGSDLPLRKARVVARRWFKTERVFTDNNGHFQFTKRFKHKVRILVKLKNSDAQVRNIRGVRFWQMLFAVKRTLGIYSSNKSSIPPFIFNQEQNNYSAKANMYWSAATVHNGVQEYRDFASLEQIGLPPQGLKIFVSRSALIGNGGGTPMFAKRADFNLASQYVLVRLSNVASIVQSIIAAVKGQIDMIIGYRYENSNGVRDVSELLSDRIKETTYHELTHTQQFAALGTGWYTSFVNAETYEIVNTFISDIGYNPYGRGTDSYGPIIALGEGWAYYIGHFFADRQYGTAASCQNEQGLGTGWCFGSNGSTGHPHLDVEENFDPNLSTDHFNWIPQGLFNDLRDPANEVNPPNSVNDLVSGYTNAQMFSAFQPSIVNLQGYRTRLLQTVVNNTSTNVTGLFSQYHY